MAKSPGLIGDFTKYTVSSIRICLFNHFLAISQEAVVLHQHISFQCNYLICLFLNICSLLFWLKLIDTPELVARCW